MNEIIETRKAMVQAYYKMREAFGEICENQELLDKIARSIDDLCRFKMAYLIATWQLEPGECPICGMPQPLMSSGVCQHCEESK